jgi:hypothetical protein
MPSIFVWKASIPNPSKKNIRCYSGSNWVVEDNDYSSRSYKYLQQNVIPGPESVITFLAKNMPQDWVGSELLEVHHVPYELIRSDAYGTLEHIGNWMRMTTCKEWSETEFTREYLQAEWNRIQQWLKTPTNTSPQVHPPVRPTGISNAQRSKPLRKEYSTNPHHTRLSGPPISIPSISVGASHTIDPHQVRQNFQEFYAKFGSPAQAAPEQYSRGRSRPPRY